MTVSVVRSRRTSSRICRVAAFLVLWPSIGTLLLAAHFTHIPPDGDSAIMGSWSDSCPCHSPCPCWHTSHASARLCANVQFFSLSQGTIDGRSLRGKRFVLIGAPLKSFGLPIANTAVVEDERDRQLVLDVIRRLFGESSDIRVQVAKLSSKVSAHREQLTTPRILKYDIEMLSPETPPSPEVLENLYPWLLNAKQGRVKNVSVRWPGGELSYVGSNSILADIDEMVTKPEGR
jgi:Protein of unknown function (DUF1326)